jgi:hypothetical protein
MNQKGTAAPWRRSLAGTTHCPFTALCYQNQEYLSGPRSHLERKTDGEIAYLHDQQRPGLQKFIGHTGPGYEPASNSDRFGRFENFGQGKIPKFKERYTDVLTL